MKNNISSNMFIFFIMPALLYMGCNRGQNRAAEIPEYIRQMDQIDVFSPQDISDADTVHMTQEQTFGNAEDVFIKQIWEFNVGAKGRVFIIDGGMGSRTIHVFEPNGDYIGNLGSEGEGPGDFSNPCCMRIRGQQLMVYDHGVSRLSYYSAETLELLNMISTDPSGMSNAEPLNGLRFSSYYPLDQEKLLLRFATAQSYNDNTPGIYRYFTADKDWEKLGSEIFQQDQLFQVWGDFREMRIMKLFPFLSKPLITVTHSGRIFVADSDEFLIRELNHAGEEIGGFYYPIKKAPLTRDDALTSANEMEKDIAEQADLPDRWPALQSMWSDDKERLWLSTFTEKEDELKWWVIDPSGELIGTFNWPGNRYAYPLINGKTFKYIRDDYFYTYEENEETDLAEVVKYRIEFKEKEK